MRTVYAISCLLALALALPQVGYSHPLGRGEYSLRMGARPVGDQLELVVIGEIPMADVISGLGRAARGRPPTKAQQEAWTMARLEELAEGQRLFDGESMLEISFSPVVSSLQGRAIDGFFVYSVRGVVDVSRIRTTTLRWENTTWSAKPVVYSSMVRSGAKWSVTSTNACEDWTPLDSCRRWMIRVQPSDD